MPGKVQAPDHFEIGIDNYTPLPYLKNSEMKIGGYKSRQQYCWEVVQKPALDSIPSGSTILSATTDVKVVTYNSGGNAVDLEMRDQDKGAWSDDGASQPSRVDPSFFDETEEYATILTSEPIPASGSEGVTFTLSSTPELVAKVQGWLDGTIPNNGFLITYYPDYYAYWITIDSVVYTIEYESGSGARRRITIIS